MLAADADFQIRLHAAAALGADAHQLPHAFAIEHLKRIVRQDLSFDVVRQETARVVAAQSKRSLRQIVCAEREELRVRAMRSAINAARGNSIIVPT